MRIGVQAGLVYYLLNKPTGVVTTTADTHGRPIVTELVPDEPRVFPVGRLDQDTEGLLLLTNDGDLAQLLTHPSFGVEKEYLAEVEGTPTRGELRRLREGVELDDGLTAPAKVTLATPRSCESRFTKVANAKCGECARRWAIRSFGWCARESVRWPIAHWGRESGDCWPIDEVRALERATAPGSPPTTL